MITFGLAQFIVARITGDGTSDDIIACVDPFIADHITTSLRNKGMAFERACESAVAERLEAQGGIGVNCYLIAPDASENAYRRLEAKRRYLALSSFFGLIRDCDPVVVLPICNHINEAQPAYTTERRYAVV